MNLHLSDCTLGGGTAQRRSVQIFEVVRVSTCACTGRKGDALVATGLFPQDGRCFIMSWCSKEVRHGTGAETMPLELRMCWWASVTLRGQDRNSSALLFDTLETQTGRNTWV